MANTKNYEQYQDIIIKEYQEGKSISQLAKDYPVTYGWIQKMLRNNNVTIRGGRKKIELTTDQLEKFKQMYVNNEFDKDIAQEFNINVATVRRIASELKLHKNNHNRINKRIKSDYFSVIDSPEKAYWLGFLFTDGSVDHYKTTGRIRLQLQVSDEEILHQYKEDLGLDCAIIYDKRPGKECVSVEFTDEQIFNDLAKYNIIPNKTYASDHIPYEKIPPEFLSAFALGLFDGDGCLTYSSDFSSDVTLNFTSYYESTIIDFQYIIDKILVPKENSNKNIFTSAWHTQWRGRRQVLSILDCLYENCPRHLDRKYQKYLKLKQSLNTF